MSKFTQLEEAVKERLKMVTQSSPPPQSLPTFVEASVPPTTSKSVTILTASDVDQILQTLDPETALASQREVFTSFSAPSTSTSISVPPIQTPQRHVLTSENATTLFMPARVAQAGGTACKIVSVPKESGDEGLPASTIVMDENTGKIKALINARKLTALRNACGRLAYL
jgi:ornithine cyclodeaminase/alanine dehydrogenase-like protein (mu-crystallin family)